MSSNASHRFPSDAEERLKLVESPEMEVPLATCPEENVEIAPASTGAWEVLPRSEVSAALAPNDSMQELAQPVRVDTDVAARLHQSSEADPECKVPTVDKEALDPTDKLLQHVAEFTNVDA